MTDSEKYEFVHLDEDRNLFVSRTFLWVDQKHAIIQWIDKILQYWIQATPNTPRSKTARTEFAIAQHTWVNITLSGTFKRSIHPFSARYGWSERHPLARS